MSAATVGKVRKDLPTPFFWKRSESRVTVCNRRRRRLYATAAAAIGGQEPRRKKSRLGDECFLLQIKISRLSPPRNNTLIGQKVPKSKQVNTKWNKLECRCHVWNCRVGWVDGLKDAEICQRLIGDSEYMNMCWPCVALSWQPPHRSTDQPSRTQTGVQSRSVGKLHDATRK